MNALALVTAIMLSAAVITVFIGLGRLIEGQSTVRHRVEGFSPSPVSDPVLEIAQQSRLPSPLAQRLNRAISTRGFAAALATDLARANLPLTVPEFVLLNVASVCVLALLVMLLTRQPAFAAVGGVVGILLPRLYVRRQQIKRLVAFQEQLPDVLTLLVGSLRSGYGITIAMDAVAKQMPAPTSDEFARVVREIGLGVPTAQALANLVRRIRSDDLDLMVTAIAIQYEVGGNLAAILETIVATIRERVRLKGQLRTLMAQQSLQRYILTGLPLALGVVIYLMNPQYMLGLFTPGLTLIIPIGAVVLLIVGYFVMGKLSKIEI